MQATWPLLPMLEHLWHRRSQCRTQLPPRQRPHQRHTEAPGGKVARRHDDDRAVRGAARGGVTAEAVVHTATISQSGVAAVSTRRCCRRQYRSTQGVLLPQAQCPGHRRCRPGPAPSAMGATVLGGHILAVRIKGPRRDHVGWARHPHPGQPICHQLAMAHHCPNMVAHGSRDRRTVGAGHSPATGNHPSGAVVVAAITGGALLARRGLSCSRTTAVA